MIATTIEQSKHLVELGLNPTSADMTYKQVAKSLADKFEFELCVGLDAAIKDNLFSYRNGYVIPAWSMSALLGILPTKIVHSIVGMNKYLEMDIDILGEERVFSLSFGKDVSEGFYCGYDITYCDDYGYDGKAYAIITYDKESPIIPFYNAVIWLLENHRMDGDGKLLY